MMLVVFLNNRRSIDSTHVKGSQSVKTSIVSTFEMWRSSWRSESDLADTDGESGIAFAQGKKPDSVTNNPVLESCSFKHFKLPLQTSFVNIRASHCTLLNKDLKS